ncbi:hypothetical protein, partial [Vogesella fluminis]|uniref:hypothetical protein n=1 Tax=Vogesella fluminis TaxID=1069161 RepID=UPI001E378F37
FVDGLLPSVCIYTTSVDSIPLRGATGLRPTLPQTVPLQQQEMAVPAVALDIRQPHGSRHSSAYWILDFFCREKFVTLRTATPMCLFFMAFRNTPARRAPLRRDKVGRKHSSMLAESAAMPAVTALATHNYLD